MRRYLSFSNVLSMVALFAVLGGSAYAVDAVTSKLNNKDEKRVRQIARTEGKKQANQRIDKRESGLNVRSARKAGTATTAASAKSAKSVEGVEFAKFEFNAVNDTGESTIATFSGLQVKASCNAVGDLDLTATASEDDGTIHVAAVNLNNDGPSDEALYGEDDDFDTGQTQNLLPPNNNGAQRDDSVQATFTFRRANGAITTATYYAEEGPGAQPSIDCAVAGTAQIVE